MAVECVEVHFGVDCRVVTLAVGMGGTRIEWISRLKILRMDNRRRAEKRNAERGKKRHEMASQQAITGLF